MVIFGMDEGLKFMSGVLLAMCIFFGGIIHWQNTVTQDRTIFVTQISEYDHWIFIYSFESDLVHGVSCDLN